MKTGRLRLAILAAGCLALGAVAVTAEAADRKPDWTYPVVKDYGRVHPLPDAAVQPDKGKEYKTVFDVTTGIRDKSKPDGGLVHVARAVNVFGSAGVPASNLHFAAVLHGDATPAVLNDQRYRAKYGVDNPNARLISELRKAGVKVEVCGQALADNGFRHDWVDKDVTITLSALSDLTIYGDRGYAYARE